MAANRAESAAENTVDAARAWRQALPRVAQSEIGLTLMVQDITCDTVQATDAAENIADNALLCLLEGHGGMSGLVAWDPAAFAAFVAFRMTGKLPGALAERPATRVDAKLTSGFVGKLVQAFGHGLGDGGDTFATMNYSGFLADARLVQFALPEGPLTRARMEVQFASSGISGSLQVILPSPSVSRPERDVPKRPAQEWSQALGQNVHAAPMRLDAVLARLQLPLSLLLSLQVGQIVSLPGNCLDGVSLESGDGRTILTGRLGRASGDRAVRVANAASGSHSQLGQPEPQPAATA
ncbi:hypothetical protein ACMU_09770 [Actibacterium mucosum KCTC 23349]|uniref:Flagellar motor switch protein FliN-like C-terminal domain-containing protein n=2 Tax=Actibacterium TaxID=1433986 RepID=A0A037ZHX2_9RHOB|nr:hypothetical protein ACMU_09770 [Actibacterium mucosum KCTC 23349]